MFATRQQTDDGTDFTALVLISVEVGLCYTVCSKWALIPKAPPVQMTILTIPSVRISFVITPLS